MTATQESPAINLRSPFDILPADPHRAVGPLMIAHVAIKSVSNRFSIIQQYFETGWGGVRPPAAMVPAFAPALQSASLSAKRTRRARK